MRDRGLLKKIHWPKKKIIWIVLILALATGFVAMHMMNGDKKVEYTALGETEYPQDIVSQVIPQYRDLERALACVVDDEVYVLVTRGEKPTSGFEIEIDNMILENKDGKSNLVVFAKFADPTPEDSISQVLTYPLSVAKTNLEKLPDDIELRVIYE